MVKRSEMRSPAQQPVVVVSGLPRSGTSLAMRMIEAGGLPVLTDNVRRADVDNPGGYYEFEPVKRTRQDSRWLAEARGKAVKMVYRLLYDLPPDYSYQLILMQRSMAEVLASQQKMLQRLGTADPKVGLEQMGRLLRRELNECEAWLAKQPNFSILPVSYNKLVADPAPIADEINRFLGGSLTVSTMLEVVDPTLYRNRQPQPS